MATARSLSVTNFANVHKDNTSPFLGPKETGLNHFRSCPQVDYNPVGEADSETTGSGSSVIGKYSNIQHCVFNGMNCVLPSNLYVEILTLSTSECKCIWRLGP